MIEWKHVLDLEQESIQVANGTLDAQGFVGIAARKLREIVFNGEADAEIEDIIEDFEILSTDPDAENEEVDEILNRLYDWGDWDHRLWIETAF